MKIVELTKQQLLYLLNNKNPFEQGQFGVLTLIGDKVYKVHYKELIDTYFSGDEKDLDREIEQLLSVEKMLESGKYNPESNAEKFQRLENTRTSDIITGVLSYKGVYIGVEMNYFEQYKRFTDIANQMDDETLEDCLKHILEIINDLLENNIVPKDIKEDNILIDPTNFDIKIIDLDGDETVYGPENYVREYPYTRRSVMSKYEEMKNRILKIEEIER